MKTFTTRLNPTLAHVRKHLFIYLLVLPGFVYTFVFHYIPIYGITIAFKKFRMSKGILGSPWVGFDNFIVLLQDKYFYKVLWNTVLLNVYGLVFGFTFIIFLALMLNEIKIMALKRLFQTFVYLPNFISWVVFAGLISIFLSPAEGPVNFIISKLGFEKIYFLTNNDWFRTVLVSTGIVKTAGFGTIVYLASMAGINPELYESAMVDGANRLRMMWHITLPRIRPTIAVMLILQVANMFNSNFEQVYNLYNPLVMDSGDVLSTYLYRTGLLESKFEMATALGLIFSLIGLVLIIVTNKIIKKMDVTGIF
ncbi:ABC transporter permease [Paenibacillus sp. GCM10027626]|uniref:ABC transporter permease n=1 Tax=Paenibacillus sp. GCM10027626 TaxID=3273411 RepID=UPI0036404F00